ncbi:hypothetical protein HY573_00080 [Candidatus Parcubacteria bacterium]|nr:hypothetical protein [Candidatus Parcubacteria bacterium]
MERREQLHHLFFTACAWRGSDEVLIRVGGTRQRGGLELRMVAPDGWEIEFKPLLPDKDNGKEKPRRRRRLLRRA